MSIVKKEKIFETGSESFQRADKIEVLFHECDDILTNLRKMIEFSEQNTINHKNFFQNLS